MSNASIITAAVCPWTWRDGEGSSAQPLTGANREQVLARVDDEAVRVLREDLLEQNVGPDLSSAFDVDVQDPDQLTEEVVRRTLVKAVDETVLAMFEPDDVFMVELGPDAASRRWYAISTTDSGCPSENYALVACLAHLGLFDEPFEG